MGGTLLYKETLKDLLTDPIPQKDDAYRELLDEVWESVKQRSQIVKTECYRVGGRRRAKVNSSTP